MKKKKQPIYICINEECEGIELIKIKEGWYCPNCSCYTIAPEEDGMYPVNERG